MYEEILNIIYNYAFSSKMPDKDFISNITGIILAEQKLTSYVETINFQYDDTASYTYISKILNFNILSIITSAEKKYHTLNYSQKLIYEKYLYVCLSTLEVIFHELEHIRQISQLNTQITNSFERDIITNNLKHITLNPQLYQKEHDLFTMERLAIIKSTLEVLNIMTLDEEIPFYIKEELREFYYYFIEKDYTPTSFPLLKYTTLVDNPIHYEEILVNKQNTKKIINKSRKKLTLQERIQYGLPINKIEYHNITKENIKSRKKKIKRISK